MKIDHLSKERCWAPAAAGLSKISKWAMTVAFAMTAGGLCAQTVCNLDVDGDGRFLSTTDAVILTRLALGITGAAVVEGATGSGATRRTYEEIRSYLDVQCQFATTQLGSTSISAYPALMELSPVIQRA